MWVKVLHQLLEVVAEFEIGHHLGDSGDLAAGGVLNFGEIFDFLGGNDGLLL